jgi:putative RNA 2'-phosphotransferase
MDRNLVTVSKFLAKHLRHAPDALGLTLQPGGWVSVDDLLAASQRAGFTITYDELIECVETNDKQRFSFDDTGDLIRANQGHSVNVDLQLEEKQPPTVLYHGTVERFIDSIMEEGLKKGKRHHVIFPRTSRRLARSVRGGASRSFFRWMLTGCTARASSSSYPSTVSG